MLTYLYALLRVVFCLLYFQEYHELICNSINIVLLKLYIQLYIFEKFGKKMYNTSYKNKLCENNTQGECENAKEKQK